MRQCQFAVGRSEARRGRIVAIAFLRFFPALAANLGESAEGLGILHTQGAEHIEGWTRFTVDP